MEQTAERTDVIDGFGDEWTRFDQTGLSDSERLAYFEGYFEVFPWDDLPRDATGFDLGCGSGRWAEHVARRVGTLHCVDPSDAIDVARRNLAKHDNVVFHRRTAARLPFETRIDGLWLLARRLASRGRHRGSSESRGPCTQAGCAVVGVPLLRIR